MRALKDVYGAPTPQSEALPGREEEMTQNAAGGFAFRVNDWKRAERFLILGTEGGTYYTQQRKFTKDNAQAVERCIKEDGERLVQLVVDISHDGRAPKNDQALFAMAMALSFGDEKTRKAAAAALPSVARIGTHLFHFAEFVNGMRGWGRSLKTAVARWYLERDEDKLAYQLLKYRQRDGWSHRDLLRLTHPKAVGRRDTIFRFAAQPTKLTEEEIGEFPLLRDYLALQDADEKGAAALLKANPSLSREMIPTTLLGQPRILEALFPNMPLGAMIRNLGVLTKAAVLKPLSDNTHSVVTRLSDEQQLRKARIHPIQVLLAASTYKKGHGVKGDTKWDPIAEINEALDNAFVKCFQNVEPIDKRIYIGLDVSGSMGWGSVANTHLTPREGAAAMSMVFLRRAARCVVKGFTSGGGRWSTTRHEAVTDLKFTARSSLTDIVKKTSALPFGGTDCALPMLDALEQNLEVDAFIVITDNETWAGNTHPSEALARYRRKTGIPAKLVVIGMTATECSIADQNDAGMMDVVGFDTAAPALVQDFIAE